MAAKKKRAGDSNTCGHVNLLFVFMRLSSVRSIGGQRASQWRGKSRLSTVRFRSRRGSVTPSATRFSSFLPMAILSSAVARIIAEGIIRPQHAPNGGERLVHRCKRLGIVYVRSEIWRGH